MPSAQGTGWNGASARNVFGEIRYTIENPITTASWIQPTRISLSASCMRTRVATRTGSGARCRKRAIRLLQELSGVSGIAIPYSQHRRPGPYTRSPASIANGRRFSGGASGQDQRSSYAHDGLYA